MKILLTGATGGLGYRTLERLVKNPSISHIVANGRTLKKGLEINHPKVEYRLGDLADEDFVNGLVEGSAVIIHAAANSSPWGKYADFEQSNVQSLKNLVKAISTHRVKRFIYISSPSIYTTSGDLLNIKVTDPLPKKFINNYARTKFEAEELLRQSDMPYIILRPRALIGRGDRVIMPRLIKAQESGRLRIIGSGKNMVDMTALENVAQAIELSIFAEPIALNKTYNISNGEPVLLWEAIEMVLKKLGHSLNRKKISYPIAKLMAQLMEFRSKMTNFKEPTLTIYGVKTLAKSFTMDISAAKTYLHYAPEVSIEAAIDEFVTWYLEQQ